MFPAASVAATWTSWLPGESSERSISPDELSEHEPRGHERHAAGPPISPSSSRYVLIATTPDESGRDLTRLASVAFTRSDSLPELAGGFPLLKPVPETRTTGGVWSTSIVQLGSIVLLPVASFATAVTVCVPSERYGATAS